MQLLAKSKQILYMGFRATLNYFPVSFRSVHYITFIVIVLARDILACLGKVAGK